MSEEAGDRVVIELDPGGPIELIALTESFSGLARFYERHYRQDKEFAPKLFITKLEDGSVIAEIAPYAIMFGGIITTMGALNTVGDFVRRLSAGLRAFSDPPKATVDQAPILHVAEPVSREDAEDLKQFVRPLTGKVGAKLGIKHARFEKSDGVRRTVVEYNFASQKPGKQRGRTADRGVIPDISKEALPIYFLQSLQHLKERMIKGEVNPFKSAFVVDVLIQQVGESPRAYVITNVRDILQTDANGSDE